VSRRGLSPNRYAHLNKHKLEVFEFAAILSCALFAGAALYINVAATLIFLVAALSA